MKGKFELQFEDSEYYLVDSKTNDTIATTDKVLLKENDGYMKKLSIKNCEAIANGYDLDELAIKFTKNESYGERNGDLFKGYLFGFQKALSILGDKKFSETELYRAFLINAAGDDFTLNQFFNNTVLPMFQETEWDVEIVYEKDCYSSAGRCDKLIMADCIICTPVTYLRDENGCLILKRI